MILHFPSSAMCNFAHSDHLNGWRDIIMVAVTTRPPCPILPASPDSGTMNSPVAIAPALARPARPAEVPDVADGEAMMMPIVFERIPVLGTGFDRVPEMARQVDRTCPVRIRLGGRCAIARLYIECSRHV